MRDPRFEKFVAVQAGSRGEVEPPPVVGALEDVAENLPVHERVPLVRAGVRDGIDVPVGAEHGDLVPLVLHEGAPVGLEHVERDREPVVHS